METTRLPGVAGISRTPDGDVGDVDTILAAVEVPLLSLVDHNGNGRRLLGIAVNVHLRIVSMTFEDWGGVVDYPVGHLVAVRLPSSGVSRRLLQCG